jgi:hypothetical protein
MSDDHRFIDAHGNNVVGKQKTIAGWRGYLELFPDYSIEVNAIFEQGDTFAMFGFASGSFKGSQTQAGVCLQPGKQLSITFNL